MIDKYRMLELRDAYIEAIKSELLGPGSEISIPDAKHEILSDSPVNRYSLGILYPWNAKRNADNNETNGEIAAPADEDQSESVLEEVAGEAANRSGREGTPAVESLIEDDGLDEDVGLASQNMPSSFGILCREQPSSDCHGGSIRPCPARIEASSTKGQTYQRVQHVFQPNCVWGMRRLLRQQGLAQYRCLSFAYMALQQEIRDEGFSVSFAASSGGGAAKCFFESDQPGDPEERGNH